MPLLLKHRIPGRLGVQAQAPAPHGITSMLSTVLLVVLVLLLIGALPRWGHSRSWGWGPSGGLGLVLVIVLILVLMGKF